MKHEFKFEIPPDGCISETLQAEISEYENQGRDLKQLARRRRVPIGFIVYLQEKVKKW